MQSKLFQQLKIRGLSLPNRIMISPMCQYSAIDGSMSSWHMAHLASMALSGAGLLVIEATAISPEGRISARDSGLYQDENEERLREVVSHVRAVSPIPLGIQIGHAGRKASSQPPWDGGGQLPPEEGGWPALAPSAIAFGRLATPKALSIDEIDAITKNFVTTTQRAARLGFDYLEIHAAHGYLLSTFLSPLSNLRDDLYGGSDENRMRFPLQIIKAVRDAWPEEKPLAIRVNGSDFIDGGWTSENACVFAKAAREHGIDMITVSGGGVDPAQTINIRPGYQADFAREVKAASGLVTTTVGMILTPEQANDIVTSGTADMVALARGMLFNPRWPYHAAHVLGAKIDYPPQYARSNPANWPGADQMLGGLGANAGDGQ